MTRASLLQQDYYKHVVIFEKSKHLPVGLFAKTRPRVSTSQLLQNSRLGLAPHHNLPFDEKDIRKHGHQQQRKFGENDAVKLSVPDNFRDDFSRQANSIGLGFLSCDQCGRSFRQTLGLARHRTNRRGETPATLNTASFA